MKIQAASNINKVNKNAVNYEPVRTYQPVRSKNINKASKNKLDIKA